MRPPHVIFCLAWMLLASSGCACGPGQWWDGLHYPYSCPRCPYFNYQQGHWEPFRFAVLTGPDCLDASGRVKPSAGNSSEAAVPEALPPYPPALPPQARGDESG